MEEKAVYSGVLNKEHRAMKFWRYTLIGAPIWWLMGLNLFIYHLFAALAGFTLFHAASRNRNPIYLPSNIIYLICIILVYTASIFIHGSTDGFSSRVLAAVYNLSFWGMGLLLIVSLASVYRLENLITTFRSFRLIGIIVAVFALIALVCFAQGIHSIVIPSPLYYFAKDLTGKAILIEQSTLIKLLDKDWILSIEHPRFNVFSPYPTASGALCFIVLFMFLTWMCIEKKFTSIFSWSVLVLLIAGLIMTMSRMSILVCFFSLISIWILQQKRAILWIFIFVVFALLALPLILQLMAVVMELREGSSFRRLEIYRTSIEQLSGLEWLVGVGLKPREEFARYPLGSHSTYVSLLFKTGILGILFYTLFQITTLFRWWKLRAYVVKRPEYFICWQGFGCVFLAIAIWTLTEDIDAPQIAAFLYFSIVGIFEGMRYQILSHTLQLKGLKGKKE